MKSKKKRSSLKFVPIFRPKLGEEQKKRSSLKFRPIVSPNVDASQNETHKTLPFAWSNVMPNIQRGAMPQFCKLFYAIIRSWRPPLNTPMVAPFIETLNTSAQQQNFLSVFHSLWLQVFSALCDVANKKKKKLQQALKIGSQFFRKSLTTLKSVSRPLAVIK